MQHLLDNYYNNRKIKTILGKGTEFNGKMYFKDSLKINGNFAGEIDADGFLVIGEGAIVKANIKANSVVVLGTVEGDIIAKEKVEMLPMSRVYGNIKAKRIKISDNVIFTGKCEMLK